MNQFSECKPFDSSNKTDLSFGPKNVTTDELTYGSLRKCYSCSQLQTIKKNFFKTKRKSINRSVSSDDVDDSLSTKILLKMIDISAIDSNDFKLRFEFKNPIIKITQNYHKIQDLSETIVNSDDECDNNFKLSAKFSIVSSTSAEGGSSPADVSPSGYYSHELSEQSVDEDNWETDSNTVNCDKTCAQTDLTIDNLSMCNRPIDTTTDVDCLNQKGRTLRSNSSDSAIILPFIDSDIDNNIVSLDSGTNKLNYYQTTHSDQCSMDVQFDMGTDLWPQSLKTTSISCPHLEVVPSVVISDHSTIHDEKCDDQNVLALAIESYFTQSPKLLLRRDSICSVYSSTSSLSSLGEDDFIKQEIIVEPDIKTSPDIPSDIPSVQISPIKISAWRKVRSLVTSPFVQTYKKHKYPWVQLAGHQGNFLSGQTQGTVLKKLNGTEENCFKLILNDVIKPLVPEYRRTIKFNNEYYLELEDLLANFENPAIMDVKMGVRTYLEDELTKARIKPKLRKDMYEKMVAIDPIEPTEEEHTLKAVTKPRYMIWRETISSTASLGFRIEGIKQTNGKAFKDFKRTKSEEQVKIAFLRFLENHPNYISLYRNKLIVINETLKLSQFFKTHEIIGSSLLFVHDNKRADIWLIDFAKTYPLPNGVTITHRDEWNVGNHEDGYLIGLESLIRIFSNL